jgi:hypothetical protein
MIVFIHKWLKKAFFCRDACGGAGRTNLDGVASDHGGQRADFLSHLCRVYQPLCGVRKPTVSWFLSASQDHNDYLYQDRLGTNIGKALKKERLPFESRPDYSGTLMSWLGKKTHLLRHSIQKIPPIFQDRLGTNMGKRRSKNEMMRPLQMCRGNLRT